MYKIVVLILWIFKILIPFWKKNHSKYDLNRAIEVLFYNVIHSKNEYDILLMAIYIDKYISVVISFPNCHWSSLKDLNSGLFLETSPESLKDDVNS